MKFIDFERILMYLHLLASLSRRIYFHQKKVSEMEISDNADIENAQVCCLTPSELGDRVGERSSENSQICSYPGFYNPVFICAMETTNVHSLCCANSKSHHW